jgi:hypothetical protein
MVLPILLFPRQPLKRTRPQKAFRGDIAVFDVGDEGWLTQVALGFLIGLVSLDFGLTTVSSCFLIWLETVRDQPVPTFPI